MSKNINQDIKEILTERMRYEQQCIKVQKQSQPINRVKINTKKAVAGTMMIANFASIGACATPVFADNRLEVTNHKDITGYMSVTEEVGPTGDGSKISTGAGDYGGVSYGLTQLSSKVGSAKEFVERFLKEEYPEFYKFFEDAGEPGTESFNKAWIKAYEHNPGLFERAQIENKEKNFVKPARKKILDELGIDMLSTRARTEFLHSTAVQYGPNGTLNVMKKAGATKDMTEEELITAICDYKYNNVEHHFRSSSSKVREAMYGRYKREKKELLKIVKEEQGPSLEDVIDGKSIKNTDDSEQEFIDTAKSYLNQGTKYKMGGKNTDKLDCSGYVSLVYQDMGIDVDEMMTNALKFRQDSTKIDREEIQVGDLVFWHDKTGKKHSSVFHIGMYIGDDTVIDCSPDHDGIGTRKLSSLKDNDERYYTFGRYEELNIEANSPELSKSEEFSAVIAIDEDIEDKYAYLDEEESADNNEEESSDNNEEENSVIDTEDEDNSDDEGENDDLDTDPEDKEENSVIDTDDSDNDFDNEEENSVIDTEDEGNDFENEEENSVIDTDEDNSNDEGENDDLDTDSEDKEENSTIDTEDDNSDSDNNEEENSVIDTDEDNSNDEGENDDLDTDSEDKEENSAIDTEDDNSDSDNSEEENSVIDTDEDSSTDEGNNDNLDTDSEDKEENSTIDTEDDNSDLDNSEEDNSTVDTQEDNSDNEIENDNLDTDSKEDNSATDTEDNSNNEDENANSDNNNEEDNSQNSTDTDDNTQDNTNVDKETGIQYQTVSAENSTQTREAEIRAGLEDNMFTKLLGRLSSK